MQQQALEALSLPDTKEAHELKAVLEQGARLNTNYDPGKIHEVIRQDIQDALMDTGDELFADKVAARRLECLILRIRSRVSQMVPKLWGPDIQGCSAEDFRKVPRTLLKSIEEVLTHSADKIPEKHRTKQNRMAQDTVLVGDIVVDPAKLSDSFIENLGLGKQLARKGAPQAEKLKAKIELIPQIKEMLKTLEPIPLAPYSQYKTYRLFRITRGSRKGFILGTQEQAGEERMFVTTLPDARRRVNHIEMQYKNEQEQLTRIAAELDGIDSEIDQNWQDAKMPERLNKLLADLRGLINELAFVTDGAKQNLLFCVRQAEHWLSVKNKGACRASMNQAKRNRLFENRLRRIPIVSGELQRDKMALNPIIAREHTAVVGFYETVRGQMGARKNQPRLADPDAYLKNDEVSSLRKILHRLAENCHGVRFEPYLTFAEKLVHYFSELEQQLSSLTPDRHTIARKFVEAFVVSKLAKFYGQLLNIYEQISLSNGSPLNTAHLKQELEEAKRELQKRTVAKNIETSEYTPIWQKAVALVKNIKKTLDEHETSGANGEAIVAIKKAILEFNLPEQVRKTPV
ncbi:MAG: hypothetical protein AAB739_02990 [Patescibacteria group bacterium]